MAVKIRLARRGRKKLAIYDIVVADARAPRDGRFIEKIGQYNPNSNPASIDIKDERALHWLMVGAQPTDTAKRILSYKGVLLKKHLQVGVQKGAITQDVADARFQEWLGSKDAKIQGKVDKLASDKEAAKKAALAAEAKKRAEAEAALAAASAPVVEAAEEVVESTEEAVEAVVETVEEVVTEAPVEVAEVVTEAPAEVAEVITETPAEVAEIVAEAPAEVAEVVAEAPAEA
jgi:small subunit ribosomal protein S16